MIIRAHRISPTRWRARVCARCRPSAFQSPELDFTDADAIVVALKSRSIPADEAVALSRKAADWLRAQGARHILFKICSTFDSTDRGNIGQVMDALRADAAAGLWW